jgi:hypothetical protein
MSTQQEAQERATAFATKLAKKNGRILGGLVAMDWDDVEAAFLAGEESGRRIAMDEMSAKIAELDEDVFFVSQECKCGLIGDHFKNKWKKEIANHSSKIADLEAQNKKLGDVVLEMDGHIQEALHYNGDTTKVEQVLNPFLRSKEKLIKQLKQERGE